MANVAVRCMLLGLLLYGCASCTSYIIPWSSDFVNTLSNSLNIYLLDALVFDCSATNTSDVVYVNSEERFNGCNTTLDENLRFAFTLTACATSNEASLHNIVNNPFVVPGTIPASLGGKIYFIGSNAVDCQNGLKLTININSENNPGDTESITITPTAPPATTEAGGMVKATTVVLSMSSAVANSVASTGHDTGGSTAGTTYMMVTPSPTSGGASDGSSNRFFVDWGIGPQVGLVAGVAAIILVLIFLLVCCICCYCCCCSQSKRQDLIEGVNLDNHTSDTCVSETYVPSSIDSTVGLVEETDMSNGKNALASKSRSPNRVAPGPPHRHPPQPPASLPARGTKYPPQNLPPLASVPVTNNAKQKPPPPPYKTAAPPPYKP